MARLAQRLLVLGFAITAGLGLGLTACGETFEAPPALDLWKFPRDLSAHGDRPDGAARDLSAPSDDFGDVPDLQVAVEDLASNIARDLSRAD